MRHARRAYNVDRFQRASGMDLGVLAQIVGAKRELDHLPIAANASFGHTTPDFTFPIGGTGALRAHAGYLELRIETH